MCLRRSWSGCSIKLARGFVTSNSWLSKKAPTFSSSKDTKNCVISLGLFRTMTLIMSGKPNKPVPEKFNLNIDEFSTGAAGAVEVVTRGLADGDYSSLEGLVTDQCIASLKEQNLQLLSEEKRKLLAVNSSDIFFTMLSEIKVRPGFSEVLFVTFSQPQLGEAKLVQEEVRKRKKEFDAAMKEAVDDAKSGVYDKEQFHQKTQDNINEFKDYIASHDMSRQLLENEILIGNYRFIRDDASENWTISQVSQFNSFEVWSWLSRRKWNARVGIHYKAGVNFLKVLRYDSITDFVFLVLLFNLTMGQFLSYSGAI